MCVGIITITDCEKSNYTQLVINNINFMFRKSLENVSKFPAGLSKYTGSVLVCYFQEMKVNDKHIYIFF
jgi:hypothetical protein